MRRTKKEQKARGRKYAAKLQQHTLRKSDFASIASCLLSKYNDKFDK